MKRAETGVELQRSKVAISRVPAILKMVPAWVVSRAAGITLEQAKAIKSDARVIPSVRVLEGLCLRFGIHPADVVSLDSAVALRDIAPHWFDNESAQAKVSICGMGNLGHAFVGFLSARSDVSVNVLVSSEARANELAHAMQSESGIRLQCEAQDIVGRPGWLATGFQQSVFC